MPTPFAQPPTRIDPVSAVASFSTVSVVKIAWANASPPPSANPEINPGIASSSCGMCSGSPMTPVEHCSTWFGSRLRAVAAAAVAATASASPRAPVAAFACPLLTMTARGEPEESRVLERWTGAAAIRLVVNSPAAVVACSPTSSARSGRPLALKPAVTADAKNPLG